MKNSSEYDKIVNTYIGMGYHDWRNIEVASGQTGFVVEDKYKAWIEKIKDRIKQSQIKASVKEDYNLLDLYWDIGREIFLKQKHAKWGELFLETVSWEYVRFFGTKFKKHTILVRIL